MRKERRNKKKSILKNYRFAAILALGIIILLSLGTFAAYTSNNSVKRVISTQSGSGILFSSNYLSVYNFADSAISTKVINFNKGSSTVLNVTVCNYAQGVLTKVNDDYINYIFKVELLDKNGNALTSSNSINVTTSSGISKVNGDVISKLYKIETTEGSSSITYSFDTSTGICKTKTQELTGGISDRDIFKITIPEDYAGYVNMKISALPVDEDGNEVTSYKATDSNYLSRIISTSILDSSKQTSWTGEFTEATKDSSSLKFSGFNYTVSGNGNGTVTIQWDSDYLAISPWFLENLGVDATAANNSVSSENSTSESEDDEDISSDDNIGNNSQEVSEIDDNSGEESATKSSTGSWLQIQFEVGTGSKIENSTQIQFYRVKTDTKETWTTIQSYVEFGFSAQKENEE
jgi:hypothetical protein